MKSSVLVYITCGLLSILFGQSEGASMRFDTETKQWVFSKDTNPLDSIRILPYAIGYDILYGKQDGSVQLGDKAEGIRLIKLSLEYGGTEAAILIAKLQTEGVLLTSDHSTAEKLLLNAHLQLTEKRLNEDSSVNLQRQADDAENGDSQAQQNIGLKAYCESYSEARKDAVKWLLRAAKQGKQRSQLALGVIYLKGDLVPKNQFEAYKWLLLADTEKDEGVSRYSARLDDISHTLIAILENRMTKEQIAEGQRAASTFSPIDEAKAKEAAELADKQKLAEPSNKDSSYTTNPNYMWAAIAFLGLSLLILLAKRK